MRSRSAQGGSAGRAWRKRRDRVLGAVRSGQRHEHVREVAVGAGDARAAVEVLDRVVDGRIAALARRVEARHEILHDLGRPRRRRRLREEQRPLELVGLVERVDLRRRIPDLRLLLRRVRAQPDESGALAGAEQGGDEAHPVVEVVPVVRAGRRAAPGADDALVLGSHLGCLERVERRGVGIGCGRHRPADADGLVRHLHDEDAARHHERPAALDPADDLTRADVADRPGQHPDRVEHREVEPALEPALLVVTHADVAEEDQLGPPLRVRAVLRLEVRREGLLQLLAVPGGPELAGRERHAVDPPRELPELGQALVVAQGPTERGEEVGPAQPDLEEDSPVAGREAAVEDPTAVGPAPQHAPGRLLACESERVARGRGRASASGRADRHPRGSSRRP